MEREDIYHEGWAAFIAGKEWTDNPYPEFGDRKFDEWMMGFDDAEVVYHSPQFDGEK